MGDNGVEEPVQVPLDVWETLQDMSAGWKKKASIATESTDPRYKSYTSAVEAIEGLQKGMVTLVAEEHNVDFPAAGALSCYMGRLGVFLATSWATCESIALIGVGGNKPQVDAIAAVVAALGFKCKAENEDRRGLRAWIWEFAGRPGAKMTVELFVFPSLEKASVSRLEQLLSYRSSQAVAPRMRKVAVATAPAGSARARQIEREFYDRVEKALRNNLLRAKKKGFLPEEPLVGMGATKGNIAFVEYFDGDTSKLAPVSQ